MSIPVTQSNMNIVKNTFHDGITESSIMLDVVMVDVFM